MRRAWAILTGILFVAGACSNGGNGTPTSTSSGSVTMAAKPKRTVSLACSGPLDAAVHVDFIQGGALGTTVVGSADLGSGFAGGCGTSTVATGVGKADGYKVAYTSAGGGCFAGLTATPLPGKGDTDTCVVGTSTPPPPTTTTLTLTIK